MADQRGIDQVSQIIAKQVHRKAEAAGGERASRGVALARLRAQVRIADDLVSIFQVQQMIVSSPKFGARNPSRPSGLSIAKPSQCFAKR